MQDQDIKEIIIKLHKQMGNHNPHYDDFIIDPDDLMELIYEIKKCKHWCYNCLNNLNKQEIEIDLHRCFNCEPEYKTYYKKTCEKLD
jgi:hypothetical protein